MRSIIKTQITRRERSVRSEMWILATVELLMGAVVFWLSFRSFFYGGKGNGFKIYVGFILILNTIIALCR